MPDDTLNGIVTLKCKLQGHTGMITDLAWTPDGKTLLSASRDRTVRVWDIEQRAQRFVLSGGGLSVYSVVSTVDSRHVISGSGDSTVRIWNLDTGNPLSVRKMHSSAINQVRVLADGERVVTASDDGSIKIWGLEAKVKEFELYSHHGSVSVVAISSSGSTIVSGSPDGWVGIWTLNDEEVGPKAVSQRVSESEIHGDMFANSTSSSDRWSSQYFRIAEGLNSLLLGPDERTLICACEDGTIRIWDMDRGQLSRTIEGHTHGIASISLSHDCRYLASKSFDGTIRIWRMDDFQVVDVIREPLPIEEYAYHFKTGYASLFKIGIAFNPKHHLLATTDEQGTCIRIWELNALATEPIDDTSLQYTTAKLALLGDSGVGKTTLGWQLAHDEFREQSSTHGQQFWVIDQLSLTREDGTECEAVLWDFAGQPDYRLIHAVFLDDIDLALVLFDASNQLDPLQGAEYWLKQLANRENRSHSILVGARVDRGIPPLSQEELEHFCSLYGVSGGYIATSAKSGEGLDSLQNRIREQIDWDSISTTVTSRTFKRIKEYVLALKEDNLLEHRLLSPRELRQQLEGLDIDWMFSEAEMMTAVKHLATHGYVAILRGSSGETTILLSPELLANLAASFILEARRDPSELGVLVETNLIHGKYRFPELESMTRYEQQVLLDAVTALFINHNLCFRETLGAQTLLVFPALINQKRPQLDNVLLVDDSTYIVEEGPVEKLYSALVVLLGYTTLFTRVNLWQNLALYEMGADEYCGLKKIVEHEGILELVTSYDAETPQHVRDFFESLLQTLMHGHGISFAKYPQVTCPKCNYIQDRAQVVNRIRQKKAYLFCGECGQRISISPLRSTTPRLEQTVTKEIRQTTLKTKYEAAITYIKGILRDRGDSITPSCFISYAWGNRTNERWVERFASDLRNAGINVYLDRWDVQTGNSLPRFMSLISESDYIAVIGTPSYREKYDNEDERGTGVAAEMDLINTRLIGTEAQKSSVLPILREGEPETSFPPFLQARAYSDFTLDILYFVRLFGLILQIYRIPINDPAVVDLKENLEGSIGHLE